MNFKEPENITLENLAGGACIEKFDNELKEVIENILDQNFPAIEKRTITLKVTFKASVDRNYCAVTIDCKAGLAGKNSFTAGIYVGKDEHGNPVANQNFLKQGTFEDLQKEKAENKDNVTHLSEAK